MDEHIGIDHEGLYGRVNHTRIVPFTIVVFKPKKQV